MKKIVILNLLIIVSLIANSELQLFGNEIQNSKKSYIVLIYRGKNVDTSRVVKKDTFSDTIFVYNDYQTFYGSKADSIFNLINNVSSQAIFYRYNSIVDNSCLIGIDMDFGEYILFDFSKSYLSSHIFPNFENNKFDWIYNCMCYMKSKESTTTLPNIEINEWRKLYKLKDIDRWKKYKWKKVK